MTTWMVLVLPASTHGEATLTSWRSRAYVIHTDLTREEAVEYGKHMDIIFSEYRKRFSESREKKEADMPLYLFRHERDYLTFMSGQGFNAGNTGGMFFYRNGSSGLATFLGDRAQSEVFSILQHEGFHQFAFAYIGHDLPVWVNEGLAQYFQDGVVVHRKLRLGMGNADRIALVKHALRNNEAIDFDELLQMSHQQWIQNVNNGHKPSLMYAQSWSVVYFLIKGDGGKYQRAFFN